MFVYGAMFNSRHYRLPVILSKAAYDAPLKRFIGDLRIMNWFNETKQEVERNLKWDIFDGKRVLDDVDAKTVSMIILKGNEANNDLMGSNKP